ncbi:MAG TPA: EAL domain-containing protein [Casimicrobiaceae bacterium]|nr:EAL domain-containing protein [Casimicrobiaceae bacterium]
MTEQAFVARQAIVDRRQRLVAYELLFRSPSGAGFGAGDDAIAASRSVVANALLDMGTRWLLGDKLAFVNMGESTLMSALPGILPADKVVIEILETVEATREVIERVRTLREAGYRFALDDYDDRPALRALLPLAAYVKVDVLALGEARAAQVVASVRRHPAKLVAEKVETRAQYDACLASQFDLFQGFYFARPETFATRVLTPSQATILALLRRVAAGAEAPEIEQVLKRDVALTVKLMHYVSSAGFGRAHEARSLRHVIAFLGQRPLVRWLAVLLATSGAGPGALPLARTALARGRLCELLGSRVLGHAEHDDLFVAGVFSLLDAMLGVPMDEVLERLALPAAVADALAGRGGPYGPVLSLVEALESQDMVAIVRLAGALGLPAQDVSADHLQALAWVEQLGLD